MDNETTIPALPAVVSVNPSALLIVEQDGVTSQATVSQIRAGSILTTDEFSVEISIEDPTNTGGTPLRLVNNNRTIGDILGVDYEMVSGSCTITFSIADQGGGSATNISSLVSLSVSTTVASAAATANNTMQKTGSSDRQLLLTIASASGDGPLQITLRYTR